MIKEIIKNIDIIYVAPVLKFFIKLFSPEGFYLLQQIWIWILNGLCFRYWIIWCRIDHYLDICKRCGYILISVITFRKVFYQTPLHCQNFLLHWNVIVSKKLACLVCSFISFVQSILIFPSILIVQSFFLIHTKPTVIVCRELHCHFSSFCCCSWKGWILVNH